MGNFLCRNLYAHIASGYHNTVTGFNNRIQILNSLCILDLCNDLNRRTSLIQNFTNLTNCICCTYKGCSNKIKALLNTKTNICLILIGKSRQLNFYIWYINSFFLSQFTAIYNLTNNICVIYFLYLQLNQSVINQNPVAFCYVFI